MGAGYALASIVEIPAMGFTRATVLDLPRADRNDELA